MNRHARTTSRQKESTTMKAAKTSKTSKTAKKAAASTKAAPAPKKRTPKAPAEQPATTTTDAPTATTDAPKAKKAAKAEPKAPREASKKTIVLDLLRRADGATMAEIAEATSWQKHSIRGFISGNITKKMGLTVESTKTDAGERRYRIAAN